MSGVHQSQAYLDAVQRTVEYICSANSTTSCFGGKTILVTGASGQIGTAFVRVISAIGGINVLAACRNEQVFEERFGDLKERNVQFVHYEAACPLVLQEKVDYIVHCAGYGDPASFTEDPIGVMRVNIIGLDLLLDLLKQQGSGRLLFVSSGEVYGQGAPGVGSFTESYCGNIDATSFRSCYPVAKRAGETLCASYLKQHCVDFVIARQCHVYGPGFSSRDSRVTAELLGRAGHNQDLVLNSTGSQRRSFLFELDVATAYITLLEKGATGRAYNVAPPDSASIFEFAEMIASISGLSLRLKKQSAEADALGYGGITRSVLDSTLLKNLGWRPCFELSSGLEASIKSLRQADSCGDLQCR